MPTLRECVELLQSSIGGGVFTQENLTEVKFAEAFLGYARATCIKEMYPSRNNVNEIYYQYADIRYEEDLQEDDCYTLFRYPAVLNINSQIDGHQYLGKFKGDVSWTRVKSFAQYSNLKNAMGSRIKTEGYYYVLEPQAGLVRVFHTADAVRPKTAVGYSIFQDPLNDLTPFNRQLDQYPITPECLNMVEQYLRDGRFVKYLQRPANVVANGADDIQTAVPQS